MSARTGDWSLLGRGRDPVPGEPTAVQRLADGYQSTASDIDRLAGQLRDLSHLDGWKGKAAEKFADAAEDLAGDLTKSRRRYEDLAAAVRGWVQPLSNARDESMAALNDAVAADEDRRRHSQNLLAGIPNPTPAQETAQQQQQAAHTAALTRLKKAQQRLDEALQHLDDAARSTSAKIRAAGNKDGDSWWDNAKGWVRDHAGVLKKIADVLEVIGTVLAAITLVVALVASAPVWLLALGVGASVLVLGLHASMAVSDVQGSSWGEVGWDVAGLALTLATFGAGKLIARALPEVRAGVAAASGEEARTAQTALERGAANYTRAGNATRIEDAGNNLRRWGEEYLGGAAQRVTDAGARAAGRIEQGVVTEAPWATRLQTLDKDLAEQLLEVQRLSAEAVPPALKAQLADLGRLMRATQAGGLASTTKDLSDAVDKYSPLHWHEKVGDALSDARWRLTHGW